MTDATKARGIARDDRRLTFVPVDEASVPPDGMVRHIKERWWCVCPDRGLIFFRLHRGSSQHPQCNADESLARRVMERLYPWAECRFVASVFVKDNDQ